MARHRRPTSLAQTLRRATGLAVCCTAGLAVGVGLAPALGSGQSVPPGDPTDAAAPAATSPTRVERLVAEHDCWTGSAPEATVPSRAVVTLPGRRPQVAASQVGFDLWLGPDGTPGNGDERAGRLHAFCR